MSRFLVQSVAHSLLSLFLVEASLRIWQVESARERFRHRMVILVAPLLMFPLFQWIQPERGSFYFSRDIALFTSATWLGLHGWGTIPLSLFFWLLLAVTAAVTLVQEVGSILRNFGRSRPTRAPEPAVEADLRGTVAELSRKLGIPAPAVLLGPDRGPSLLVNGTRNPSIIVSETILEQFGRRQLRSALAHELAHIVRRSNVSTLLAFVSRMLMFYNPVSLFVFRRLVQDDEQVCDDITVSATGDREALARLLQSFLVESAAGGLATGSSRKERVLASSSNLLLKERIFRLQAGAAAAGDPAPGVFWLTLLAVVCFCYLVV
ncbi:MAG: M56 family metallopeptidase [Acidobacteriota bacterium]